MKKRLYIAAVNQRYGSNVFLPYAAGLLWGYASKFPEITAAYELGHAPGTGFLYLKEPIEKAIERMESPDVLALSSYIWNHQWNKALAKAVHAKWPKCIVIVGGVQIPPDARALAENPEFDFAIYGEGEGAFADFLRTLAGLSWPIGCANVGSLIWWTGERLHEIVVNPRRDEVPIETIPSPYLFGLFDDLIAREVHRGWSWQALQETNRGCPYSCTFCAWGAASLTKLREFSGLRVTSEYRWMAKKKIEFLYNCDANFAISKRDVDLTDALIQCKAETGYPKTFRAAFAKNSNDVVFEISKKLAGAHMLKATTLALQSMKDETLGLIKRKNIKYEKLQQLSERYERAGIATYAEIIVGLPGETLDSFVNGLDALLDAGQHDSISIYLCMVLENTEMALPEYRKAHGLETVPMKALLYHGTPEPGVVEEIQETVVATSTMSRVDLRRAVVYGWLLQAFHGFGLTQHMAKKLRERGIKYSEFYWSLWKRCHDNLNTVAGGAFWRVVNAWLNAEAGKSWPTVDLRFGDVMWPPEELLFLDIACRSGQFYDELRAWCEKSFVDGGELVDEQRALFIPPEPGKEAEYARDAVWYGRKSRGTKLRLRNP